MTADAGTRSTPRGGRTNAAIALLALLAATLAGAGAPSAAAPDDACTPRHVESLGPACLRPDGLWDVVLPDGTRIPTHGPDPLEPHGHGTSMGLGDPERAPVCATDFYQHVLYARSATHTDRYAAVKSQIQAAVRRMNHVLNEDGLESGGVTADFKVLCDANGAIRVDPVVVTSSGTGFADVVYAAKLAGHDKPNVDYTIFFDRSSSSACGVGTLHRDDRPDVDNMNNYGGAYGVTYVGCWNSRTVMHENGHNQGAVQPGAPGWDGDAHCVEQYDVMCYWYSYNLNLCMDRVRYDCRYDTYFDAAPEPGDPLQARWNIGSRVNRFIRFGDQPPVLPGAPTLEGTDGDGQAHLSWTPALHGGDGPTAYRVYRDGTLLQQVGAQTSHTDTGLTNGQTYQYRVSALNAAGEGPQSDAVGVTPLPPNQLPTACFSLAVTSVTSVDGACSADPDGSVASWTWVWGDGTPNGTGAQATHAYQTTGTHALSLVVTDDRGGKATLTQNVVVTAVQDPDPSAPTLLNGQWVSDSAGGVGSWKYYKIHLPASASGPVTEIRGSGCVRLLCDPDLDLYLRKDERPTTTAFDCRASEAGQAENCFAQGTGWWYVGVHVESGGQTGAYTIRAFW